jgi:hypothetical protein
MSHRRHRSAVQDPEGIVSPFVQVAVSGTVFDKNSIVWPYSILQFFLVVPSGQTPVETTTGLVIPTPPPVIASATGTFSIQLQTTATVVPSSQWCVTIFPFNDMMNGQTLTPFNVTGALTLTSMIAAQLIPLTFPHPFILPMAHSGPLNQSSFNGSTYFDVVSQQLMVRNPATASYIPIGPSAAPPAQVYPGTGVAVSTGTAWGTSINPADIPRLSAANAFAVGNTFTGTQLINSLRIGDRTTGGPWAGGFPNINGNAATLVINPGAGGSLFLADDTLGTIFLGPLASVDQTGHAIFPTLAVSGTKTFRIRHPLKETKDLIHACLEGPENGVYYRGSSVTVAGSREITLPDYFEALTSLDDRTVLLTAIADQEQETFGQLAASPIVDAKFVVRSSIARQKFYWEVKAIRRDIAPLEIEPDKAPDRPKNSREVVQ